MKKWTRRKKILSIFIFLILIGFIFSGQFTESQDHFYFKPLTKTQPPYFPGSYENYSIYGSSFPWQSNATGYINVSSNSNTTILKIHVMFSSPYSAGIFFVNRTVQIENIQGKFYYNGSRIFLPFFYTGGDVISGYSNNYNDADNNSYNNATPSEIGYNTLITPPGIYQYHNGIYITTDDDNYIFAESNKILFGLEGLDPVINNVVGVDIPGNHTTYPVPITMVLHSTNYIIFPVDWPFIIFVFIILVFLTGWFIFVPVIILLVIASYRNRKKKKERE